MTTTVVTQLAALLGDGVDHSHHVWHKGERLAKYPPARMWCDTSGRKAKA